MGTTIIDVYAEYEPIVKSAPTSDNLAKDAQISSAISLKRIADTLDQLLAVVLAQDKRYSS